MKAQNDQKHFEKKLNDEQRGINELNEAAKTVQAIFEVRVF